MPKDEQGSVTTLPSQEGTFQHATVLRAEVVQAVATAPAGWLIDCTLGGGGHTEAILQQCPHLSVLGLDKDPAALQAASARLQPFGARFACQHAAFAQLREVLTARGMPEVSAVIADLGVSSHQFDTAARGFSFRLDGPLDMRMDPTRGTTLAERLETVTLEDLADVLYEYGDIRRSIGTARIVLESFREGATTTGTMAAKLEKRLPRERSHHPATAVFQALRIWVNGELDELETLLRDAPQVLAPEGVLAIISFHSGEDRLVKRAIQALAPKRYGGQFVRDKDLAPQATEIAGNPRARSARLRVLRRAGVAVAQDRDEGEEDDGDEGEA
jgi:16S rRNA (cytosine1402-N4)-methyltransferase